jgi:hypothetical protein
MPYTQIEAKDLRPGMIVQMPYWDGVFRSKIVEVQRLSSHQVRGKRFKIGVTFKREKAVGIKKHVHNYTFYFPYVILERYTKPKRKK